jgi:imidazolonepropionase-like amidohydrolase
LRLIRATTIITGHPGETITGGEILIDGSRVRAVGPYESVELPRDVEVEVVDLPGRTVLPGLVDAHVHLGFDGRLRPRDAGEDDGRLLLRMAENARKLVSAGVTTARDLGCRDFLDVTLRDAIEDGLAVGPHLAVATRPITITGGHCWYMGGEADDEAAIRRVARENLRAGADCLKIMASGGQMTPGALPPWREQFTTEQIRVVVQEAAARGKSVAAHAHGPAAIRSALDAGVRTIEHCTFLTANGADYNEETVDRIAAAGVYVCPTAHGQFWKMRDMVGAEVMDGWLARIARMRNAGVRIIAGTDSGFGFGALDNRADDYVAGLEVLAEAGFSNEEVLQSATLTAAEACGLGAVTGSLEPGKSADLIAVHGDPLTKLAHLRNLDLVLVSGRAVTQAGIDTTTSSVGGLGR